jgi:hypothetical protein
MNLTVEQDETASTEKMIEWRNQYDAFVASRRRQMPSALWRHFGIDSFHDGLIKSITWERPYRSVEVGISCPNVKFFHSTSADDFEFLSVDFVVCFEGVHKFSFEQQQDESSRSTLCPKFLYAEVETAEEEIREANERTGEQYHSLLIKADVFRAGIIFEYLDVRAAEPTATEWMMRDSRYKFPFLE